MSIARHCIIQLSV